MSTESNDLWENAPEGAIYVCGACGKTSQNRAGYDRTSRASVADPGWDESCMLNAILCRADSLVRKSNGRVASADPVEESS